MILSYQGLKLIVMWFTLIVSIDDQKR